VSTERVQETWATLSILKDTEALQYHAKLVERLKLAKDGSFQAQGNAVIPPKSPAAAASLPLEQYKRETPLMIAAEKHH